MISQYSSSKIATCISVQSPFLVDRISHFFMCSGVIICRWCMCVCVCACSCLYSSTIMVRVMVKPELLCVETVVPMCIPPLRLLSPAFGCWLTNRHFVLPNFHFQNIEAERTATEYLVDQGVPTANANKSLLSFLAIVSALLHLYFYPLLTLLLLLMMLFTCQRTREDVPEHARLCACFSSETKGLLDRGIMFGIPRHATRLTDRPTDDWWWLQCAVKRWQPAKPLTFMCATNATADISQFIVSRSHLA